MKTPHVIVIGGGFAGLSAAVALASSGVQVDVLEARGELGGRASSFRDRGTGEWVDNGQHVLMGCYHETFAFLRAIGAERDVNLQHALEVTFVDAQQQLSVLRCPAWRPPLNLAGGVVRWDGVGWRARLSALRLGRALRRARAGTARPLDDLVRPGESVAQWLARHGQHGELCTMLWEPLALAALNEDPARASALPFVRVLGRMMGASARDAALGIPAKPLVALYGEPARRRVEAAGGRIRTHNLARVRLAGDRIVGVEVRDVRRPGHRPYVEGDAVIVSVPWFDLPRLFIDETQNGGPGAMAAVCHAAAETAASPIVSVNLWFDREVLPCAFVGLPGRALQWAFDKRAVLGENASHVTLVGSGASATLRQSNDTLAALAIEELGAALPSVRRASLRRTLVVREPRATFSVAPGQPARPATTTAVPNLVLAGDWVDTGLPGTIEGACLSGRWAAEAVRRLLGMG
ncbi:MAG: FAD-dependent oxidoreductase [Luteitalea sp.]|nr:FAD-dependent oxidoreductase [Luteitalea sp.]